MSNYSVYSDFDIQKHMSTFINYLEVIVHPSGKVEYAVPSHQEKLVNIMMQKHKCSHDDVFYKLCPKEKWVDFGDWLMEETGCLMVWSQGYMGKPNHIQRKVLDNFIYNGIMNSEVIYE